LPPRETEAGSHGSGNDGYRAIERLRDMKIADMLIGGNPT
jgi:hypothetical protein